MFSKFNIYNNIIIYINGKNTGSKKALTLMLVYLTTTTVQKIFKYLDWGTESLINHWLSLLSLINKESLINELNFLHKFYNNCCMLHRLKIRRRSSSRSKEKYFLLTSGTITEFYKRHQISSGLAAPKFLT